MPVFPNGWFSWGDTVAVVDNDRAWSVGADGWLRVNAADVEWDGRPISEAAARRVFAALFDAFGEPPVNGR